MFPFFSKMASHYSDVANNYNYLYELEHQAKTPIVASKLHLTPDDLLLDIGAATGQLSHFLWKHVGLKNPVTCVEPCEAFFEHASKLDGIVPVTETAERFCDQLAANKKPFNKVLLVGVVHHIDDILKCLDQIIGSLPKNGICLILKQPYSRTPLPFAPLHLQHIKEIPEILDDILPYVKRRDDIITEVTNEQATFRLPKSRWYHMIRSKFWSTFRRYTDEEIEESIKELDNGRFLGVKDDELITIVVEYIAVAMTKK